MHFFDNVRELAGEGIGFNLGYLSYKTIYKKYKKPPNL